MTGRYPVRDGWLSDYDKADIENRSRYAPFTRLIAVFNE